MRGLDLKAESIEELGLMADRSRNHVSCGGPDLKRVLRTLSIGSKDIAVDLGSGKGGAMLTLARFPFGEIMGVEISKRLVSIAESNASRLHLKNVHFVCEDAGKFRDLDRFTFVLVFNPFPDKVMQEVMANLQASLVRRPRSLIIIYKGPDILEEMVNLECFFRKDVFYFPYAQPFYVYSNGTAPASPQSSRGIS
jgi:cyclopropane fatty-acyl-phospholipid synthase-like methyltransferase